MKHYFALLFFISKNFSTVTQKNFEDLVNKHLGNSRQAKEGSPAYQLLHTKKGNIAHNYFLNLFNWINKKDENKLDFSFFVDYCVHDISMIFQLRNGQPIITAKLNFFLFIKNFKNRLSFDESCLKLKNENEKKDDTIPFLDSQNQFVFFRELSAELEQEKTFISSLSYVLCKLKDDARYTLRTSAFLEKERESEFAAILDELFLSSISAVVVEDLVSKIPSKKEKMIIQFLENLSDADIGSSKENFFNLLFENKKGHKIIVKKILEYNRYNLGILLNLIIKTSLKNIKTDSRKRPREIKESKTSLEKHKKNK